jgi:hypothetical protein
MIRAISIFATCFSLALILAVGSLSATPLAGTAKGLSSGGAAADAIQKVHGCHAFCRRGPPAGIGTDRAAAASPADLKSLATAGGPAIRTGLRP